MKPISTLGVSLAWCVLGYFLLDRGDTAGSLIASMAAITTACIGRGLDGEQEGRGSRALVDAIFHHLAGE